MIDFIIMISTILLVIYLTYYCLFKQKGCSSCKKNNSIKKYYKKALKNENKCHN